MADKSLSQTVSTTHSSTLNGLVRSIADMTMKPVTLPSWSKNWLEDIPAEVRLMIYEQYFKTQSATIHASPFPEYKYASGETSHNLVFPECPKSSIKQTIQNIRRSYKNLFFVCKIVKHEAYEVFLEHSVFVLAANTCILKANFLHYQPVRKIVWATDPVSNPDAIPKLALIAKAFASKQKLKTLGIFCSFDAYESQLRLQGAQTLFLLLPYLKEFDAQYIFIKMDLVHFTRQDDFKSFVAITPVHSRKGLSTNNYLEATRQKKTYLEEIIIFAPDLRYAKMIRSFFLAAMMLSDECCTSKVVYFVLNTSFVEVEGGRERKQQKLTHRADIESIRKCSAGLNP